MANEEKARNSRSKTETSAESPNNAGNDANWGNNTPQPAPPQAYQQPAAVPPPRPIEWSASEYVERKKNSGWFVVAAISVVVLTALVYVLTKDMVSTISIGIVGLTFAAFAGRPPRVIEYSVDNTGVNVGQKHYEYEQFSSFSVMQEDAVRSILLMPVKRFGLPLVLHYDPNDEEKITSILGAYLPHEQREVEMVDRLMTKIHF